MDGYDLPATAYPVEVTPVGYTAFTDAQGNFITTVDSGTYNVFPDSTSKFHPVPGSLPVTFHSQTGISSGNNFALQPVDPNLADLGVYTYEAAFQSRRAFLTAPIFITSIWAFNRFSHN